MNLVIAIGLALITALLAFFVFLNPGDAGAWVQGFGLVAVLALMATGERRRQNGRSLWAGVSPWVVGYCNVALGVLFTAVGVIFLSKESYMTGGFNFLCGLGLLALGLFSLFVLPKGPIERDASKRGSRPS